MSNFVRICYLFITKKKDVVKFNSFKINFKVFPIKFQNNNFIMNTYSAGLFVFHTEIVMQFVENRIRDNLIFNI